MQMDISFILHFKFPRVLLAVLDNTSVSLLDRHIRHPTLFGSGPHDCALNSLYWAVPSLSEKTLIDAFKLCTARWPYAGVYNSEFASVLDHLELNYTYTSHDECFGDVLTCGYQRAVVLFKGHFAPVINGRAYGRDARYNSCPNAPVECKWIFR